MKESQSEITKLGELRVKGLIHRMPDFLLKAEFHVGVGERAVFVGRSGSGKTTLLRILAGLEPLTQGEVQLAGRSISKLTPAQRQIGMVFQEQVLFPGMSTLENAVYGLKVRGVSLEERQRRGREWLKKVHLLERENASVTTLSIGERQRVAWVRALIWQPQLLLLDEPFSALDLNTRQMMRQELLQLHALWPAPLILVTHDPEDAQELGTVSLHLKIDPVSRVHEMRRQLPNEPGFA